MLYDTRRTYAEISQLIEYNQYTGLLRWKGTKKGKVYKTGWFAGTIQTDRNGYQWHKVKIKQKQYKVSHIAWLIMTGNWPLDEIDHKDRDSFNNRYSNLREATHSQNCMNTSVGRNNLLGIKGVSLYKKNNKYVARIKIEGKQINLGYYNTAQEASWAYEVIAKAVSGVFYYNGEK